MPVKPITGFDRWEALSAWAMSQEGPMRIAAVGAGAGGAEILLAIQHRLGRQRAAAGKPSDNIEFHLFSNTEHILPTHNTKVRAAFLRTLQQRNVVLHLGEPVQVSPAF